MLTDIQELNFPDYATLSSATVTLPDMAEKTITSTVKFDGAIKPDFSKDWACAFRGEKYIQPLKRPQGAKENTTILATVDLTFQHWAIYQLKRFYFVQLAALETGTVYVDKYIASLNLNLYDFVGEFAKVLKYYFGDKIKIDLNPDWVADTEATTVSISYSKIWKVLTKMYELYGVRWEVTAAADNDNTVEDGERYVIRIGYAAKECAHIFEYGHEGGLLKVQQQVQSEDIYNIALGRGCDKNLPYRYFKDVDPNNPTFAADPDWIPELASVYFSELRGATFRNYVQGWKTNPNRQLIYTDSDGNTQSLSVETYDDVRGNTDFAYAKGHTDETFDPVEYVKDDASIAKYGEIWNTVSDNEDVWPTIQKRTIAGLGRIDQVVAVEQIESDDIEGSTSHNSKVVDIDGANASGYIGLGEKATITVRGGNFLVPDGQYGVLELVNPAVTGVLYEYSRVTATHEWKLNFSNDCNSFEIIETRIICRNLVTGATTNTPTGLEAGEYSFTVEFDIRDVSGIVNTNNLKKYELYATCSFAGAKLVTSDQNANWNGTFKVWLKNLWNTEQGSKESDTTYANRVWVPLLGDRTGSDAKLVFTSGLLCLSEDYEFVIAEIPTVDRSKSIEVELEDGTKKQVQSEWCMALNKCDAELETLGVYLPSTTTNAVAGDSFYLYGIDPPHEYTLLAEQEIDDAKTDALTQYSDIKPTWAITLDKQRLTEIYESALLKSDKAGYITLADGSRIMLVDVANSLLYNIAAGMSMRLADARFIEAAYETLYVSQITYTYNEPTDDDSGIVPDVEVTLADGYSESASVIDTISSEISSLSKQVGSLSNIEQLVRIIGDKLYLRKDGVSDRSVSPTEFMGLLTSVGFVQGALGGTGWGFFKDANGDWALELPKLTVRKELQVNSLVVNQVTARGGMYVESAAYMAVSAVEDTTYNKIEAYKCYFDQQQGSVHNMFRVDDVAMSMVYNPDWDSDTVKYYKRKVLDVGDNYITLSKDDANGDGVPTEGDVIVQYGNYTDKTRQFVKVGDVVGGGYERYIEGLTSVYTDGTEYYFVGRQNGMYNDRPRWFIGDTSQYIEWVNGELNVKGKINALSTINGVTVDKYVTNIANDTTQDIRDVLKELQDQVDGVVQAYNGKGEPTLTNYPASEWTTDNDKLAHNGDTYTDVDSDSETAGQTWKWYYVSSSDYGWIKIADSDATKALQLAQQSIVATDVLYTQTDSATKTPDTPDINGSIWSTNAPDWEEGYYIWSCTKTTNGLGVDSYSVPVCISGKDGRGVKSIVEWYYLSSSQTALQGSMWETPAPTWKAGYFMWTKSVITYTDGTTSETDAICVTGSTGAAGTSVLAQYSADGSSWHSAYQDGDIYMHTSSDNGTTWTEAVRIVGEQGESGRYTVIQWAIGTDTKITSTSWSNSPLTAKTGEYIWIRTGVVYPPATEPTTWSQSIRLTGDKGETGAAGSPSYILDLDNEIIAVPCTSAGSQTDKIANVQATVYGGMVKITSGIAYSITSVTGLSTATIDDNGLIVVDNITADTATVVVQAVLTALNNLTLQTTLTLYKVRPGTNGTSAVVYSIEPSVNNITKSLTGVYSTKTVSVTKYKTTGSSARATTTEKYLFYQRIGEDDAEVRVTSTAATVELPAITDNTTALIISLRNGTSNTSTLLDRERIPVLTDASDLSVGGENILRDSAFRNASQWWSYNSLYAAVDKSLTYGGANSLKISVASLTANAWRGVTQNYSTNELLTAEPLKYVTLSVWTYCKDVDGIDNGARLELRFYDADGNSCGVADTSIVPDKAETWQRFAVTTMAPEDAVSMRAYFYVTMNGTLWIAQPKLERGTIATEWSPCSVDSDYITKALQESSSMDGGLVLASLLRLGYTDSNGEYKVMSGVNGVYDAADDTGGLAFWAGGEQKDAAKSENADATDKATFAVRHDGTAYAAGNTVRFSENEIEIGDNIVVDAEGLKLVGDDSTVRVEVANKTVGDAIKFDDSQTSYSTSVSFKVALSKVTYEYGSIISGPDAGAPIQAEFYTPQNANVNRKWIEKSLAANSRANVSVDFKGLIDMDDFTLRGYMQLQIGYEASDGSYIYVATKKVKLSKSGKIVTASVALSDVVLPVTSSMYFAEISILEGTLNNWETLISSEGSTKAMTTTSGTLSATISTVYSPRILLGNDGLLVQRSNCGLLCSDSAVIARFGTFILRVSSAGVQASSDGGDTWRSL